MKTIITLTIMIFISITVQAIAILPWWCFLVPIFLLGIILPLKKWKVPSFFMGFVAGFLSWSLSTLYFEAGYNGEIMTKMNKLIDAPDYRIMYAIIGSLGGILTGLAFYSGFLLRRGKEVLQLEVHED